MGETRPEAAAAIHGPCPSNGQVADRPERAATFVEVPLTAEEHRALVPEERAAHDEERRAERACRMGRSGCVVPLAVTFAVLAGLAFGALGPARLTTRYFDWGVWAPGNLVLGLALVAAGALFATALGDHARNRTALYRARARRRAAQASPPLTAHHVSGQTRVVSRVAADAATVEFLVSVGGHEFRFADRPPRGMLKWRGQWRSPGRPAVVRALGDEPRTIIRIWSIDGQPIYRLRSLEASPLRPR